MDPPLTAETSFPNTFTTPEVTSPGLSRYGDVFKGTLQIVFERASDGLNNLLTSRRLGTAAVLSAVAFAGAAPGAATSEKNTHEGTSNTPVDIRPNRSYLPTQSNRNIAVLAVALNCDPIRQVNKQYAASGNCKVAGKTVPVKWNSINTVKDSARPNAYVCGDPVTGKARTIKLQPYGLNTVALTAITKNKYGGKQLQRSMVRSFEQGGEAQLMCGRPPVPPKPLSEICDWGTPPSNVKNPPSNISYCGTTYFRNGQAPFKGPVWDSKPTINNNVISIPHIVSPGGICRAAPYRGDSHLDPSPWEHILQRNYWQCGEVAAETDFGLYLVNPDKKTCRLPDTLAGQGIAKFSIPVEWGGVIEMVAGLTVRRGKEGFDWTALSQEPSNAYLYLKGTKDGCAELGLPAQ